MALIRTLPLCGVATKWNLKKRRRWRKQIRLGLGGPPEFYLHWKLQDGCATCGGDEERRAFIASVRSGFFLPGAGIRRQQRARRRGVFGRAGGQIISRDPA